MFVHQDLARLEHKPYQAPLESNLANATLQKRIHYAFEVLREQGWTQEELDMVYAPIGLDLGAQTPEEIALSIVSEYLAVVRGKKGGSLRKGRVIHES